MLTNRLQRVQANIQAKQIKSYSDTELLEILDQIDRLENLILSTETDPPSTSRDSKLMLEMIIRPASKECTVCGRTLK